MKPEFKSIDLAHAFNEHGKDIARFQRVLDETSEDIRNLERYLQDCGICLNVVLEVTQDTYLSWEKHNGTWRIVANYKSTNQPLIESKAGVRLYFKDSLPCFVQKIAEEITI